MLITSFENEKIKNLIKLQQKKYRDLTNTYIVEGEHLVEEAYKANKIIEIYTTEELTKYDSNVITITNEIMKKVSLMDTPPTIIALCRKNDSKKIIGNKIVLLDKIQDPGNLGTIIRSSLAFNVDTIILSNNTVDLYNPKVLRGTQGMIFHINIISMDTKEAINELKSNNIQIYGTNVINGINVRDLSQTDKEKYCLIMGNEGNGLSKEIQELCDKNLYIPMNDKVESLNVGVACSIILYELGK